jgi:hypothetical protein
MTKYLPLFLAACSMLASAADVRTMRANITGGDSSSGKCTVEVTVDEVARVEIAGGEARLITERGQPGEFRRLTCTAPLPRNMSDFRFRGVDGRGRQDLVADPRNNRGIAVVRIEDSKGGREGYTFDIEWNGGSGHPGFSGNDHRNARFTTVSCSSNDGRRHLCQTDTRYGVRLLKQNSGSPCEEGRTWGYERGEIWVDRGCRADFEVRLP